MDCQDARKRGIPFTKHSFPLYRNGQMDLGTVFRNMKMDFGVMGINQPRGASIQRERQVHFHGYKNMECSVHSWNENRIFS
jgi:hypothetical protein